MAVNHTFYLLRNAPAPSLLGELVRQPGVPCKLSHRLLTHLRKTGSRNGADWENLCLAHTAKPQFTFELEDDTVRVRLLANSDRDRSCWQWNGLEWQVTNRGGGRQARGARRPAPGSGHALVAAQDWFTPEPGLWVGDANEQFRHAGAGLARPAGQADYLANPAFQHLFLAPRQLKPRIVVQGSGIDWFAISSAWEQEGLKLTPADLERLATARHRFVKLPTAGWWSWTSRPCARRANHGDLGPRGLSAPPQKVACRTPPASARKPCSGSPTLPETRALRQACRF